MFFFSSHLQTGTERLRIVYGVHFNKYQENLVINRFHSESISIIYNWKFSLLINWKNKFIFHLLGKTLDKQIRWSSIVWKARPITYRYINPIVGWWSIRKINRWFWLKNRSRNFNRFKQRTSPLYLNNSNRFVIEFWSSEMIQSNLRLVL